MKKLLYIKHSFHNKTKSNDFLQEILKTKYEIEFFDYDNDYDNFEKFSELDGKEFDTVVIFQIMPSISMLDRYIKYKHIAFFPMYDASHRFNMALWNEYRKCNIINFSSTLHKKCKSLGLSSFYIQYFPKPIAVEDEGDEHSIFFWQRRENINTGILKKLIDEKYIKTLYLHNVPDPKNKSIEPSEKLLKKTIFSNWFETKEEMQKYIQKSALYFCPRKLEGIGMSFLEAMAMGRCVIAVDKPTMNEYIQHGKTGYLYNLSFPKKIHLENLRQIQHSTREFIEKGYEKWESEKFQILEWINFSAEENSDQSLMDEKLLIKNPEKKFLCKVYTTTKRITYKIFNIMPLSFNR